MKLCLKIIKEVYELLFSGAFQPLQDEVGNITNVQKKHTCKKNIDEAVDFVILDPKKLIVSNKGQNH